jgi:sulfatase maturation enzyme AslB (radical SAM superfamily)
MANIMVTERCNLSCPYCFADEFVNKRVNEISIENFRKAVDFITTSRSFTGILGMIGGEPALHSKFPDLLTIVDRNVSVKEVVIFTNGVMIDETISQTSGEKFSFLINLNAPSVIGEKIYSRITRNIEILVEQYNKKNSITLGLNLYEVDADNSFFVDILQRHKLKHARLSITTPNSKGGKDSFEKFSIFKNQVYQLYVDLRYHGISVVFDCNKIPACLWTDEEIMKLSLIQANNENKRSGFNLDTNKCNPVIDILPDLTAVRCFGLSQYSKVNTEDFQSLDDLSTYYRTQFDERLVKVPTVEACSSCGMFDDSLCYGGCLANKPGIN